MKRLFYNSRFHRRTKERLLSVKDGRVIINTLEEAMFYGVTQGLDFYWYEKNGKLANYAIDLADIMKQQRRNKLAARCYSYALKYAFNYMLDAMKYGRGDCRDMLDPDKVYETARLHLFKMGDHVGIKRLKSYYDDMSCYIALEWEYSFKSRARERVKGIEAALSKFL